MARPLTLKPFLWFAAQAEEAAEFYVSLFPGSRVVETARSGAGGPVQSCTIELAGIPITLFNGGPHFQLNEAFSLSIGCETQDEVDVLWEKLTADGGSPSRCGWCKDRFGVSWQVIPDALPRLLKDPDPARAGRALQAMMTMQKIDIAGLERAANEA